MKTSWEKIWKS